MSHFVRATILLEQGRFQEAEQSARQALAADPQDGRAHSVLSLTLCEQDRLEEATEEARQAIALAPDFHHAHYCLAVVLDRRERLDEAQAAIQEALRLDPEDPDYYSFLSGIQAQREQWEAALESAERGLQIDAEHVPSINQRALALAHLGRKEEAAAVTATALANEPENPVTHTNHGWNLLRQEDHAAALHHFREALRLDPNLDWARSGVIEALKARHLLYRLILRYFFWMSTLSSRARWGVVIGLYVVFRLTRGAMKAMPEVAPYLLPFVGLYILFVMISWTAQPLFNLLLRCNRFGRLALTREETLAANLVGLCIVGAVAMGATAALTGHLPFLMGVITFFVLMISVSGTFRCSPGWPRRTMAAYTLVLAVSGLLLVVLLPGSPMEEGAEVAGEAVRMLNVVLLAVFLIGAILASWVANILGAVTPRR